jgi:hypothetical protein
MQAAIKRLPVAMISQLAFTGHLFHGMNGAMDIHAQRRDD